MEFDDTVSLWEEDEFMDEICKKNQCTGCTACVVSCPKNAIDMKADKKGFIYPHIDIELCIDCGLCKKVCPQLNLTLEINPNVRKVYAAYTKDTDVRRNSSSGGMFTEIAKAIIQEGGVVFASKLENNCHELCYSKCDDIEELIYFRGSKYLQSKPRYIFRDVKEELENGRFVLFVGTACQVSGLKAYLRKEYSTLYAIDIICHGIPSPKLWFDYLSKLENEYNSVATRANFRYKSPSWTEFSLCVDFENGTRFIKSKFDDPYLISFLKEISLRENCYSCSYTNTARVGDITLADFWGYKSTDYRMRNTEKGISLVLINSDKGEKLFQKVTSNILYIEKSLKDAIAGNRSLREPWKKNPIADDFWDAYLKEDDLQNVFDTFCKPYRFSIKMKINWFLLNHLYLVPKFILRHKGLIK